MITIRKSKERGHAEHGWLESYHSFSFSDYYDPKFMGFRTLRVINEDWVAPAEGFGAHPHKDMEILTYIIEGQLKHKDSMGHESVIKAGDVQKMSAGSGIKHSEFNASDKETVHLLQIWIVPAKTGIQPTYQEKSLEDQEGLQAIPITFEQDVQVYRGQLKESAGHVLKAGRGAWVQVVKGTMELNGKALEQGDAAAVEEEKELVFTPKGSVEFLLFDLK